MIVKKKDSRRPPFLGRGLKFPIQIDSRTGGFMVDDGAIDATSVGLELTPDRHTLRDTEMPVISDNHISGSIANILLTKKLERDVLPEFGSDIYKILFEQIDVYAMQEFEVWLQLAIARWEYRVTVTPPDDVIWKTTAYNTDLGRMPVDIIPRFINSQAPNNLVAPFVTPSMARLQEYPTPEVDPANHDMSSRYYKSTEVTLNNEKQIKPRVTQKNSYASDDVFYKVKYDDTWYLIAHYLYGDVRFWWIIVDFYIQDASLDGEPRSRLRSFEDPPFGEVIRTPSRTRLLMELT